MSYSSDIDAAFNRSQSGERFLIRRWSSTANDPSGRVSGAGAGTTLATWTHPSSIDALPFKDSAWRSVRREL
eukprot:gene18563-25072_t